MKNVIFKGLRIRIENPAGSVRSGVDRVSGKPWSTKMSHDYGEIIGTNGVDDDPVDCFLGTNKSAPFVHVVHQLNKQTGEWDEDKCFLGFNDVMDAKAAYYKNYDNPDLFYGDIETMPFNLFKKKMLTHKGDTMIHAYGTSEGVAKAWDTRGRGRASRFIDRSITPKLKNLSPVYKDLLNYIPDKHLVGLSRIEMVPRSRITKELGNSQGASVYSEPTRKGERPTLFVSKPSGERTAHMNMAHELGHHVWNLLTSKDQDRWINSKKTTNYYYPPNVKLSNEDIRNEHFAEAYGLGILRNMGYKTWGESKKAVALAFKLARHSIKGKNTYSYGDKKIHASVTVGDPVIVDGLRGRGVIVSEDGSDVVIRYRNGEYFKRKKYNVHSFNETNYHSRYKTVQAGEEDVEMERGPITVPHGMNKRIEKVGTLFCVVADGVDKNFGCYGSRAQAEAVMSGKSFIDPDIPGGMYAEGIPREKPPAKIDSMPKMAPIKKYAAPRVASPPKPSFPHLNETVHKKFTNKVGVPLQEPNANAHKTLEGFGDLGEPMAGALGHAHIEPEFWFHPPSLEKRNRADHIPTDDPGETNNKFLDVTKRRQAHKDRMKILKHGRPGGNPPITPAITTGMAPQMAGSALKLTKRKGNKLLLDVINPRTASLVVPHQTNGYTKGIKARRTQDIRVRRAFNAAFI